VLGVFLTKNLILCIDLLLWMRLRFTITPESKQQSKQWTEAGCSAPKKTSSVPSAGKVMALMF
jgi:hypothetical protein